MISHARQMQAASAASPLPTVRQLKLLPLRALLGLAARCVKRARAQYASGRLECVGAIDQTIRAALAYAAGRELEFSWRAVKRAVLYAQNANAETVAVATEHLASALANARLAAKKPARAEHVLRQAFLAIEAAYDACYQDEFAEMAKDEFFRLKRLAKQHRFPHEGAAIDCSPNGPLGPEWPIWETRELLRG